MARRERSFVVLDTPDAVWRTVSDLRAWSDFLVFSEPKYYNWGRTLAPAGAPGPGCALRMLHGDKPVQDWVIEDWQSPSRLKLASTAWHGDKPFQMSSSIAVEIAPVSEVETKVTLTMECAFTHPFFALPLALAPLGRTLDAGLSYMERGILTRLDVRK